MANLQYQFDQIISYIRNIEKYPKMYGTIEDVESIYLTVLDIGTKTNILKINENIHNSIFIEWGEFVASKIETANPNMRHKFSSYETLIQLLQEYSKYYIFNSQSE